MTELTKALVGAQKAMKPVKMTGHNPHFNSKYATLEDILEAIREPLAANGLCFTQTFTGHQPTFLVTTLWHVSGQSIQSQYPIVPTQNNPQAFASACTYAKRQCIASLVGAVGAENDDDGNEASLDFVKSSSVASNGAVTDTFAPRERAPYGAVSSVTKRSDAQIKRLYAIAKKQGWSDAEIHGVAKARFHVEHLADLPKAAYDELCDRVFIHPPAQAAMPGLGSEEDIPF